MSNTSNGKWKFLSFSLIGILGTSLLAVAFQLPQQLQDTLFAEQVNAPFGLPSAYGAGALTNVFALPSDNVFKATGYYNIGFTTATTGTIKTIEITFPAGFNVAGAKLLLTQGTGAGSLSVSGQTVKYSIATPISVTAPKPMMIMIGNIVNPALTSNQVSVATKDASAVIIDGPTNSATFTLTRVTNSMVQPGIALTGNATIDSPTFKVDSTNDRVGIGTATPKGKLDVNGALLVGSFANAPAVGSNSLYVSNDGGGDPKNSFRIDGYQNTLYISANSAPGASTGTGLVLRTSPAGGGETDALFIDQNGVGTFNYDFTERSHFTVNQNATIFGSLFLLNSYLPSHTLILRSPHGGCHAVSVDDAGALTTSAISCP